MTNLLSAIVIGILAGGGTMASSLALTEETNVSFKVACYITVTVAMVIMWLDRQFSSVKSMYKKEHERNKQWRLWVRSSIQIIERKLKIESLPLPEEDQSTK